MLKIQKWVVNPCQECTHVVSDETGEAVIIDCGVYYPSERQHLLEYIEKVYECSPTRSLSLHANGLALQIRGRRCVPDIVP